MRLSKTGTILLSGGLLLATLSACAKPPKPQPLPNPVPPAVVVKDRPPSDLMVCARTPEQFAKGSAGDLSIEAAKKLVEIAPIFGALPDQINRLINWIEPGSCSEPKP